MQKISVIGLGYVGLPVALGFAQKFDVIGFDSNPARIDELKRGYDWSGEQSPAALSATKAQFTAAEAELLGTDIFILCVPTPVDQFNKPDLRALIAASQTVGKVIRPGGIVCLESTVSPGTTEELCAPEIAKHSGLTIGVDFTVGYSPERINPGDKEHTLQSVTKVVAGQDERTAQILCELYAAIVPAGIHRAPSIKVAEAAKLIENTQRDLNIALMNEIALICDRMNLRTKDVLAAARTKWNFLDFVPGLVGGHCIGVDPYYLTAKAEELGYEPKVILAGRHINDGMGVFVAQKLIHIFRARKVAMSGAKVGVLGVTFKENIGDVRNSRVPEIVAELNRFGVVSMLVDPIANPAMLRQEYGLVLHPLGDLRELDALILAVPHARFLENLEDLLSATKPGAPILDVKAVLPTGTPGLWTL